MKANNHLKSMKEESASNTNNQKEYWLVWIVGSMFMGTYSAIMLLGVDGLEGQSKAYFGLNTTRGFIAFMAWFEVSIVFAMVSYPLAVKLWYKRNITAQESIASQKIGLTALLAFGATWIGHDSVEYGYITVENGNWGLLVLVMLGLLAAAFLPLINMMSEGPITIGEYLLSIVTILILAFVISEIRKAFKTERIGSK